MPPGAAAVFRRLRRELLAEAGLSELLPSERLRLELVARGFARLDALGAAMEGEGLLVPGSQGQRRGHPALVDESRLRGELDEGLRRLAFQLTQRGRLERISALTRG